jgi:hypothetical protein
MQAVVPAGGVTARLLPALRLGDTAGSDISQGREVWNHFIGVIPGAKQIFARAGLRGLRKRRAARAGRHGWSEDDLLRAAVFYVQAGRRPVAALAKEWHLKATQARDVLQAAKEKGLLTAGRQGVASRALTERAKQMLAAKAATSTKEA